MDNELDPNRKNEEAVDTNEEPITGRSNDDEDFDDDMDDDVDDIDADEAGTEE